MNKALLALGLVVLIVGSSIVAFYYIPKMWRTTSYETLPSEEQGIPESPEGETEQFVKLNVDLFPKGGQWVRDSETDLPLYESTVSYVVSNYGTATADSVKVAIKIDGVVYKQFSL